MPEAIVCPKCGAESSILQLRARHSYDCENCAEPLRELIELDKASWEEGDMTPEDAA